jgi:hypothetical protein
VTAAGAGRVYGQVADGDASRIGTVQEIWSAP